MSAAANGVVATIMLITADLSSSTTLGSKVNPPGGSENDSSSFFSFSSPTTAVTVSDDDEVELVVDVLVAVVLELEVVEVTELLVPDKEVDVCVEVVDEAVIVVVL